MEPKEEAYLLIARGVEKFRPTADQTICWNWAKARDRDGYGVVQFKGKQWRAHRLAYFALWGTIPEGKLVLHICDNPSCVRPEHLRLGTAAENNRERRERKRSRKSRITPEAAQEFRARYDSGDGSYAPGRKGRAPGNGASLRREYGISRSTMYRVLKGDL